MEKKNIILVQILKIIDFFVEKLFSQKDVKKMQAHFVLIFSFRMKQVKMLKMSFNVPLSTFCHIL